MNALLDTLGLTAEAVTIYRPIPGWPYLATSTGRIWSSRRRRCMAASRKDSGYHSVTLHRPGEAKGGNVARFVCMAFHGLPPEPHWHVDHIDGDRTNDRPENLRWLSPQENWARRRFNPKRGEAVKGSKLTAADVAMIRSTARQTTALAQKLGVSKTLIKRIRKGKAWA